MTDEERERAYSRGKKYEFLDSTRDVSFAFAAGYEAACEDKRAEIEAERARAAKLITRMNEMLNNMCADDIHLDIRDALAEYEASK